LPSTYEIFVAAERVELIWAEIYRALAGRFEGDPAAELFQRLSAEESQHANRIRLVASHYSHDSQLFRGALIADQGFEGLYTEALEFLGAVRHGDFDENLDEAKHRVADLEERLTEAHAQMLVKGADESIRAFFEELARQDEEHRRLLLI